MSFVEMCTEESSIFQIFKPQNRITTLAKSNGDLEINKKLLCSRQKDQNLYELSF